MRSLALFIATLVMVGVLQMIAGPSEGGTNSIIRVDSSSSTTP
jgi:hypothetical protein